MALYTELNSDGIAMRFILYIHFSIYFIFICLYIQFFIFPQVIVIYSQKR